MNEYTVLLLRGRSFPPQVFGPEPREKAIRRAEAIAVGDAVDLIEISDAARLVTVDASSVYDRLAAKRRART